MTIIALGWPKSLLENNILWKNLIKLSNTSTSTVMENVTFIFLIKKKSSNHYQIISNKLTVLLQIKLTFTTWTRSFGHCSVAWHHQPVHSRFLFNTKESFREEELHFQLMVENGELETFYFRKQGCMTVATEQLDCACSRLRKTSALQIMW